MEYQGYGFGTLTDNDMMSIFVKNGEASSLISWR